MIAIIPTQTTEKRNIKTVQIIKSIQVGKDFNCLIDFINFIIHESKRKYKDT